MKSKIDVKKINKTISYMTEDEEIRNYINIIMTEVKKEIEEKQNTETIIQNRLKSKVFWLGLITTIGTIVTCFVPQVSEITKTIVAIAGSLISSFAIANNPSNKNCF